MPIACVVGADGMSGLVYAIKFGAVVSGGINAHVMDDWELGIMDCCCWWISRT